MESRICSLCGQETAANVTVCLNCGKKEPPRRREKPPDPPKSDKPKLNKALTKCRDCGHIISKSALTCPSCGAPKPPKKNIAILIVLIVLTISGLAGVMFGDKKTSTAEHKPTEKAEKKKTHKIDPDKALEVRRMMDERDREIFAKSAVEVFLKNNLNDPKSLDIDQWHVRDSGNEQIVTCRYRAKNAFGATILQTMQFVVNKNGTILHAQKVDNYAVR